MIGAVRERHHEEQSRIAFRKQSVRINREVQQPGEFPAGCRVGGAAQIGCEHQEQDPASLVSRGNLERRHICPGIGGIE